MTSTQDQPDQIINEDPVFYRLPPTGFLNLHQIIGDKNKNPPYHGLIPVSRRTFLRRVDEGIYPKPIKLGRSIAWRVKDIVDLIEKIGGTA